MKSASEALEIILSQVKEKREEVLELKNALGRCLAEDVSADRDYPPFHRATMDGFAVKSSAIQIDTRYEFSNEMTAGMDPLSFSGQTILKIATGAAVPEGFDAIIRIEDCETETPNFVIFKRLPDKPFHNIAIQGEDVKEKEFVLRAGTILSVSEISLLASLGKKNVKTFALPRVSIISTGNEVVPIDQIPLPHQIRDSNTYSLVASLHLLGIEPESVSLVQDDPEQIRKNIQKALDSDIVVLSGGVSMGSLDLIPSILTELGVQNHFHKILIKPGKPLWFGTTATTAVFALPGNPFSVQVCAKIFLEPYILAFQGKKPKAPLKLPFFDSRKKAKNLTEYFPVILSDEGSTGIKRKTFNGSGDILAGSLSDGIAVHPSELPELTTDAIIDFYPW